MVLFGAYVRRRRPSLPERTPVKRLILLAVVVTAFVAAFSYPAATAAAATGCNTPVVDTTGKLGSGIAKVNQAVSKLDAAGADVRVRVIQSMGSASTLDAYEKQVEHSCPSWQDPNGDTKENLVAVFVSLGDRKTSIQYGGQWSAALDGNWVAIETDNMNPYFKMGDFAGGVANGLNTIRADIENELHPKPQPAPTIIQAPHKPANLTPLWVILFTLLGIGAAVGSGFGVRSVRRNRKLTAAAQAKALETRNTVADQVNKLNESHDALEQAAEIAKLGVADEDLAALTAALTTALDKVGTVSEAYGALHGPTWDPQAHHDKAGYETITAKLNEVATLAADATAAVADAQKLVDEFQRIANELPTRIETLRSAVGKGADIRAAATKQGFTVDQFDAEVKQTTDLLDQAKQKLATKELREAAALVAQAEQVYADAKQWCKNLPQLKATLDQDAAALEQRIRQVHGACKNAKDVFDQISAEYAESSWTAIAGNGSATENLLTAAEAALTSSRHDAGMDCQQWAEARKALDQANTGLDQADKLLAAILDLQKALATAKAGAAGEVDAAAADIAQARQYVAANDDDLPETLETALDKADATLEAAKTELAKAKPDYLDVVKGARAAHAAADKVLADARSDKDQMDRLRSQATSIERDAANAISQASSYIGSHRSDVRSSAESGLSQAQTTFAQAQAIKVAVRSHATADTDQRDALSRKVSLLQQAEQAAEQAYSQARRDVSNAEDERRREEERRQQSLYSSSYSSSSLLSSGGGGGGGFDFGGGGSTDWGGGGGGGGSTGW